MCSLWYRPLRLRGSRFDRTSQSDASASAGAAACTITSTRSGHSESGPGSVPR